MQDKQILYTFNSWEDYNDLMQHLEAKGVKWITGRRPTKRKGFAKINYDITRLLIFLDSEGLTYGDGRARECYPCEDYEKMHWRTTKN